MDVNRYQVGGNHYLRQEIQPWDAMRAWMSPEEFSGFLRGNVIKYVARDKGDRLSDLRKAAHYIEKLITLTVELNSMNENLLSHRLGNLDTWIAERLADRISSGLYYIPGVDSNLSAANRAALPTGISDATLRAFRNY